MLVVDDLRDELERHAALLLGAAPHVYNDMAFDLQLCNSAHYVAATLARGTSPWDVIIADVFMQPAKHRIDDAHVDAAAERTTIRVAGHDVTFWQFTPRVQFSSPNKGSAEAGGLLIVNEVIRRHEAEPNWRRPLVTLVSRFGNTPERAKVDSLVAREHKWLDYRDKARWGASAAAGLVSSDMYVLILGQLIARLNTPVTTGVALGGYFVHSSPAMQELDARLHALAKSSAPTIWITGEPGAGRRTVAHVLHEARMRAHAATGDAIEFTPTVGNESDFERRLLGYRVEGPRGATDVMGAVQQATASTLMFVDAEHVRNPAQMAIAARLLRREPVQRADGAVVDTTAPALVVVQTAKAGFLERFSPDFQHALNSTPCVEVPPLRKRAEDIPMLALRVLEQDKTGLALSLAARARLQKEDWRNGNIDLLVRVVRDAVALETGRELSVASVERALKDANVYQPSGDPPVHWAPHGVNPAAADSVLDEYKSLLVEIRRIKETVRSARLDRDRTYEGVKARHDSLSIWRQMTPSEFEDLVTVQLSPHDFLRARAAARYHELTGDRRGKDAIKSWNTLRNRWRLPGK